MDTPSEPPKEPSQGFRFGEERQERIFRLLQSVGPGPASFFKDACELMSRQQYIDSTTHLVGHLMREIESALRAILIHVTAREDSGSLESMPLTKKRPLRFTRLPFNVALSILTQVHAVVRRASQLVRSEQSEPGLNHRQQISAVLKGLEIEVDDPVAVAWLNMPGRKREYGLDKRAHRQGLGPARPVDAEFLKFWDEIQAILFRVLEKSESKFLNVSAVLGTLAAKVSPTKEDLRILKTNIPNNGVTYGYFFDSLASPDWLEPLAQSEFFDAALPPIRNDERSTVGFPPWPQGRYLARMAQLSDAVAARVVAIAVKVPDSENIRVYSELVNVALSAPPHRAAQLVERARDWIKLPYSDWFADRLAKLVGHLATGEECVAALRLAEGVFALRPATRGEDDASTFAGSLNGNTAYMQDWEYQEALKAQVPPLVECAGVEAAALTLRLLDKAVELDSKDEDDDYSFVWRRAVETTPSYSHGARDLLVMAAVDACSMVAARDGNSARAVLALLDQYSRPIFKRIGFHLLRLHPDGFDHEIRERLTDSDNFDNVFVRREFELLLRDQFQNLGEAKPLILQRIEAGPDLTGLRKRYEDVGEELPDHVVNDYERDWRKQRLVPIQDSLPEAWRHTHAYLLVDLPPSNVLEEVQEPTAHWVGPTSPKTAIEIAELSIDDLIGYLQGWEPSGEMMSPSREGLARVLQEAVPTRLNEFVTSAERFSEVDPIYVRAVIGGIIQVAHTEPLHNWVPVLKLCKWAVEQTDEIVDDMQPYTGEERGWRWTRTEIVRLLSRAYETGPSELPFEHRELSWSVLEPITDDINPSPAFEAHYGGSNSSPADLAINTTRGEAMNAAIRYGLWVHRHLGIAEPTDAFAQIPELKTVLDRHLDKDVDPSLSVRSVYGHWLPWLILLDRTWTEAHLEQIFPPSEPELRDAAWTTYVAYVPPYDSAFDVLRNEYLSAIDRLGTSALEKGPLGANSHLVEHIITFYWRGKITIEDDLLAKFYAEASLEFRAHAIDFIGRAFGNSAEVPPGIVERAVALWEMRASNVESGGAEKQELESFGWWFDSGKFSEDWAIEQLLRVVRLTGEIDPAYSVTKRLAEIASTQPLPTVEIMRRLVKGDLDGWGVSAWRDELSVVIAAALASGIDAAIAEATALVNELVARGYREFRDLIS